jgi:sulfate adenylyltransferase
LSVAELSLTERQYLEFEKIALGAFAPLSGFMNEDEFVGVVHHLRLPNGQLFPLPVVLDLSADQVASVTGSQSVTLLFDDQEVGELRPESVFRCDKVEVARKVYGTDDVAHPGVAHFLRMGDTFVGGEVRLRSRVRFDFSEYELTPAETRAHFEAHGFKTVAGFQTRNVPHRAHEYLQRLALEHCDSLFIQPLVGSKKPGDYLPSAILAGYRVLIDEFLPADRVLLGVLSTAMRYAGPREALFHAIIRRNYGCTHFVVGRDHAGVGNYYRLYEAHELTRRYERELGISILRFSGPFYCRRCDGIVTQRHCPHIDTDPNAVTQISGTSIRAMLSKGTSVRPELLRPEVAMGVKGLPLFIEDDAR